MRPQERTPPCQSYNCAVCGFDDAGRRRPASGAGFASCACWRCWPSCSCWRAGVLVRSRSRGGERDPGARPGSEPALDVDTRRLRVATGDARARGAARRREPRARRADDIAPIMRQAIVSVEDQRFYEHNGVDVRGIARALWAGHPQQGVVEGGSTITQQFVKNAYIRNERTIARKVREAALAWQLEQRWSKDRILTAYLNTIYFGNGAYGIQQAARTYFEKGAKRARRWPRPRSSRGSRPTRRSTTRCSTRARRSARRALRPRACSTSRGRSRAASCAARDKRAAAEAGGRAPAGHAGPAPVLRELRQGPARREVRRRARLRRRAQGDDDDRPRPAAEGAARRSRASSRTPTARPPRSSRSTRDRRGEGDVRRHELPREPVQPRHAGRAAARLGVQADRARDGDAAGHLAR